MNLFFRKNYGLIGALACLVIIYVTTAARNVTGYADSDELVLAAKLGGVAHPPGYPLYILLLNFWLYFPWRNSIMGGSFFSGFMQLSSLLVLGIIVRKILPNINQIILGIGLILLGLTNGFWSHAVVSEVFGLNNLLILLTILGLIYVNENLLTKYYQSILIGLVWGLGITHHPTYRAMLPLVIYTFYSLWIKNRKIAYLTLAGTILGLGSYLGLWILNNNQASYSWPIGQGFEGLWQTWNYQIYSENGSAVETLKNNWDLGNMVRAIKEYGNFYYSEFGFVGIILSLYGGIWMLKKDRKLFYILFATWLLIGLGIAQYMKFPIATKISDAGYYWGMSLRYRMLLGSFVIGGMAAILGLGAFYTWIKNKKIKIILVLILIVWLVVNTITKWSNMNWSNTNFVHYYSQTLMSSLPEKSVLIVDDDIIFSLLYKQLVQAVRNDIDIVPATWQMRQNWALENTEIFRDYYTNRHDQIIYQIANLLADGRRVFVYGLDPQTLGQLGIEGNPFYALPNQYTIEIVTKPIIPKDAFDYGLTSQLTKLQANDLSNWDKGWMGHLSLVHTTLGYIQGKWGNLEAANLHLDIAKQLAQLPENQNQISLMKSGIADEPKWNNFKQISPAEWITLSKKSVIDGNFVDAKFQAERAVLIDPDDLGYRENLIAIMEQMDDFSIEDQIAVYKRLSVEQSQL